MKRSVFVMLGVLLCVFPLMADRDTKIAVIDIEKIYTELSKEEEVQEELKEEIADAKRRVERAIADIKKLKQKMRSGSLSESRIEEVQYEIEEMEHDLSVLLKEQENILLEKEEEISQRILLEIQEAAEKIAREKKIDLIFIRRDSGVIYADSDYDITTDVIQYMQKRKRERRRR